MRASGQETNRADLGRALPPWTHESARSPVDRRHFGSQPKTVTLRGVQALSEEGQFVQHLREGGELVSLKDLVERLHACCRIVDPVDVMIDVFMEVVVFQEKVSARDYADVAVEVATD